MNRFLQAAIENMELVERKQDHGEVPRQEWLDQAIAYALIALAEVFTTPVKIEGFRTCVELGCNLEVPSMPQGVEPILHCANHATIDERRRYFEAWPSDWANKQF